MKSEKLVRDSPAAELDVGPSRFTLVLLVPTAMPMVMPRVSHEVPNSTVEFIFESSEIGTMEVVVVFVS